MITDAGESHLRRVSHWKLYFLLLTVVLVVVFVFSLNIGFSHIPFENILKILAKNIPFLGDIVKTPGTEEFLRQESIIMQIRMPRVLGGALVGVALAAAGVAYQGIFRNPMADPYTIGAMGGASFGAAVAIVLGVGVALLGVNTVPIYAFIGALGAVFLVYVISREGTRVPVTTLILSGLTVTIFFNALVTYLKLLAGNKLHALTFWIMGGFTYTDWTEVSTIFPLIIIGVAIVYLYARDLNILVLGEEQAQHLGVELEKVKKILLACGALMTAAAVSISGLIGFVGLIIPHLTRIIVGPDHRILLPTSAIVGASFMMICDSLARVIIAPSELPVGVITAVSGGPFFIYLLRRKRGGYTVR
jgi:iron complex transport system permease protein